MLQILAVGLGGFVGAIARYTITGLVHRRFPAFLPAGTMVVNVLGCFLIGVLMELVIEQDPAHNPPPQPPLVRLNPTARLLLITGFLGSLTTFSTFGYETVQLLANQDAGLAMANIAGNLLLGLPAVWLGRTVIQLVG